MTQVVECTLSLVGEKQPRWEGGGRTEQGAFFLFFLGGRLPMLRQSVGAWHDYILRTDYGLEAQWLAKPDGCACALATIGRLGSHCFRLAGGAATSLSTETGTGRVGTLQLTGPAGSCNTCLQPAGTLARLACLAFRTEIRSAGSGPGRDRKSKMTTTPLRGDISSLSDNDARQALAMVGLGLLASSSSISPPTDQRQHAASGNNLHPAAGCFHVMYIHADDSEYSHSL